MILSEEAGITLSVEEGTAPEGRDNLAVQAAELFFSERGLPPAVHLSLWKRIPSEAGLGGGSADAAAVLRGLNRLQGMPFSEDELAALGARLGADVPFCIAGGAARCRGIGEKLTVLPSWESLPLVIVRPDISVSTKEAYQLWDRKGKIISRSGASAEAALKEKNTTMLAASLCNDFETVLFENSDTLWEASAFLKGFGRPALLSGSGSAFFLMAGSESDGEKIVEVIHEARPDWFAATAYTTGGTR